MAAARRRPRHPALLVRASVPSALPVQGCGSAAPRDAAPPVLEPPGSARAAALVGLVAAGRNSAPPPRLQSLYRIRRASQFQDLSMRPGATPATLQPQRRGHGATPLCAGVQHVASALDAASCPVDLQQFARHAPPKLSQKACHPPLAPQQPPPVLDAVRRPACGRQRAPSSPPRQPAADPGLDPEGTAEAKLLPLNPGGQSLSLRHPVVSVGAGSNRS
mmetsp:Transcript_13604/g.36147  ORF Transcript_13604/g.36147 Transcript_13604/m.36147 type:complete len:219 (-) Transcript_13604:720-1376(-)